MGRYRKMPVEIEADQFDGSAESGATICEWISGHGGNAEYWADHFKGDPKVYVTHRDPFMRIVTLEGTFMVASVGDWVIRGVKGEFYPCKPDIFEATHEASDG